MLTVAMTNYLVVLLTMELPSFLVSLVSFSPFV